MKTRKYNNISFILHFTTLLSIIPTLHTHGSITLPNPGNQPNCCQRRFKQVTTQYKEAEAFLETYQDYDTYAKPGHMKGCFKNSVVCIDSICRILCGCKIKDQDLDPNATDNKKIGLPIFFTITLAFLLIILGSISLLESPDKKIERLIENDIKVCLNPYLEQIADDLSTYNKSSPEYAQKASTYNKIIGDLGFRTALLTYRPNQDALDLLHQNISQYRTMAYNIDQNAQQIIGNSWPLRIHALERNNLNIIENIIFVLDDPLAIQKQIFYTQKERYYSSKNILFRASVGVSSKIQQAATYKEIAFISDIINTTISVVPDTLQSSSDGEGLTNFYETMLNTNIHLNFSNIDTTNTNFNAISQQVKGASKNYLKDSIGSLIKKLKTNTGGVVFIAVGNIILIQGLLVRSSNCNTQRTYISSLLNPLVLLAIMASTFLVSILPYGQDTFSYVIKDPHFILNLLVHTNTDLCNLHNPKEVGLTYLLNEDIKTLLADYNDIEKASALITRNRRAFNSYRTHSLTSENIYNESILAQQTYFDQLLDGTKFLTGFPLLPNRRICDSTFINVTTLDLSLPCATVFDTLYALDTIEEVRDAYTLNFKGVHIQLLLYPTVTILWIVLLCSAFGSKNPTTRYHGTYIGDKKLKEYKIQMRVDYEQKIQNRVAFILSFAAIITTTALGIGFI